MIKRMADLLKKIFVKTIFDSNIDKSYFMHQYIGRGR